MDGKAGSGAPIDVFLSATTITPKGEGQRQYVEAILKHDLTFCLGPAGTGKTFLAVAVSISLLKQHKIKRIVLARPAVEAGNWVTAVFKPKSAPICVLVRRHAT
jgi:phosphate starvation-inducible PhoH-like protein